MNYKKFEELPCWIKARELCQAVYELINLPAFKRDFSLRNQIWDGAGSVMDHIAEGFDDGSPREFIRFLGYSQRSCGEVQSQLYRAKDCGISIRSSSRESMNSLLNVENKSKAFENI